MSAGDVVAAAYTVVTRLRSPASTLPGADRCARCGVPGEAMTSVGQVVSNRFTGYHGWRSPRSAVLCDPCSWGYRHWPLRTDIHLVRRDQPVLETLTDSGLAAVLSAPVPADVAVIVPARPGRKHLFPDAVWGHVTAADIHLRWGTLPEVQILAAMTRLRAAGFTEQNLRAAAPPFVVLRTVRHTEVPAVFRRLGRPEALAVSAAVVGGRAARQHTHPGARMTRRTVVAGEGGASARWLAAAPHLPPLTDPPAATAESCCCCCTTESTGPSATGSPHGVATTGTSCSPAASGWPPTPAGSTCTAGGPPSPPTWAPLPATPVNAQTARRPADRGPETGPAGPARPHPRTGLADTDRRRRRT